MQKLETLSIRVLQILGIALFILLCVTSVLFTRFIPAAYEAEIPYNQVDFFLLTCLGLGVMGMLAGYIDKQTAQAFKDLPCDTDSVDSHDGPAG